MADEKDGAGESRRQQTSARNDGLQNRIARVGERRSGDSTSTTAAADLERETLEAIARTFLKEGREYRFPDGSEAFSDRGDTLLSRSENAVVVRALVDIAAARDWQALAVSGTTPFRQAVWTQATERGLTVTGYTPEAAERARLQRSVQPEAAQPDSPSPMEVARPERLPASTTAQRPRRPITGELLEHGRAPYQNDHANPMSYFARVRTAAGERTIWGVDLERAMRESVSAPQVGEQIVLQQVRAEPVTVRSADRDDGGEGPKNVLRNRWSMETRAFVESRREASDAVRDPTRDPREVVRSQPELAGAYLALRGAEEIARHRIPHPDDRSKFVDLVRSAVSDGIERGDPLPQVKLRVRAKERDRSLEAREPGVE